MLNWISNWKSWAVQQNQYEFELLLRYVNLKLQYTPWNFCCQLARWNHRHFCYGELTYPTEWEVRKILLKFALKYLEIGYLRSPRRVPCRHSPPTSWFEVVGLANRFSPGPRRGGETCVFWLSFRMEKKNMGRGGETQNHGIKKNALFLLWYFFAGVRQSYSWLKDTVCIYIYTQCFQRL